MARLYTLRPIQTDFDLGYDHQQVTRSAQGLPLRAGYAASSRTPADTHHVEHEDRSLERTWNQFQPNRKRREERRQPSGFSSARLPESGHASTSNLDEARNRSGHPMSSRPHRDADSVNPLDGGWSGVGSLSYDRQLYQHCLSYPPPLPLSPDREIQKRRSSQRLYEGDRGSGYHLLPPPTTERFAQDRSRWSSASIPPRDYRNTPVHHLDTGSLPNPPIRNLRGLTRRPRVQNRCKRVSRAQEDGLRWSVDPETPRVTQMDYSVMSVNPDGSGPSIGSRFVHPPTMARPTTMGKSGGGARSPGTSPSHVASETEGPKFRIKEREGAGSASTNTYSAPKEPHTILAMMDRMEEESPSSSPASTPKAPPPDQHSVIREDLQRNERLIAGCRTDPRISFCEAAAVEDRKSLNSAHSTPSSPEVSHLQSHAVPADKGTGRKEPGQLALFQELYQMLDSPGHPDFDILRSKMEIRRDGNSWVGIRPDRASEGDSIPDTPRGPRRPEQALHVDILLAQKVVRDAMQEDGECVVFPSQSCMLSASECGEEEVVDSNSNWSECGLDRKHSTRSVFDWRYA